MTVLFAILVYSTELIMKQENIESERLYNTKLISMPSDTIKKPTFFLEETIIQPMGIVYIKDTALISALSQVFDRDYAELYKFISENGLKAGRTMAFYQTYTNPFLLEVAVQVNEVPREGKGRIETKTVPGGPAIVAHYAGPYENLGIVYSALTQWINEHGRQARGMPFEIYLNDPKTVSDQYSLQTEIVQLIY